MTQETPKNTINDALTEQMMQLEQQISTIDTQLAIIVNIDMSKAPNSRFMIELYDEMTKQGIGNLAKYIGRMSIRISDMFWQNEDRAKRIIANLAKSYKKMYELFKENFSEDAEQIMADNFYQTKFTA